MTTVITEDKSGEYKTLLSNKIELTKERNMFTGTEVQDMLLDLWNALNADTISLN